MPDTDHRLRPVAVQDARQFSPPAARNCVAIREVLTRVLPKKGIVLEIGSGTGEHVVQAEAPAYSAKAAGSRAAARTETVLVAAPSLVIASLVGQKGPR